MHNFKLTLNLKNNFTIGGETYPVVKNKVEVGTCKFNAVSNTVVGSFSLNQYYKVEQYLKYNTEQKEGKTWLVNLEFSDVASTESVQSIKPQNKV